MAMQISSTTSTTWWSVFRELQGFLFSTIQQLDESSDLREPKSRMISRYLNSTEENVGMSSEKKNKLQLLYHHGLIITTFALFIQKLSVQHWSMSSRRRSRWCVDAVITLIHCLQVLVPVIWSGVFFGWLYYQGMSKSLLCYLVGRLAMIAWGVLFQVSKKLLCKAYNRWYGVRESKKSFH